MSKLYIIAGCNGAGKTTCLKMISGLSTPSYGEIEMFGYKGKDLQKVRSRVGCLIEGYRSRATDAETYRRVTVGRSQLFC